MQFTLIAIDDELQFKDLSQLGLNRWLSLLPDSVFDQDVDGVFPDYDEERYISDERYKSAYDAQVDKAVSIRSKDPKKIPIVKFLSNDHWVLSAEECSILAKHTQPLVAEKNPAFTQGWLNTLLDLQALLKYGAANSGIKVT